MTLSKGHLTTTEINEEVTKRPQAAQKQNREQGKRRPPLHAHAHAHTYM